MSTKKRKDEETADVDKKRRKSAPAEEPNGVSAQTNAASEETKQAAVILEGDGPSGELLLCGGTNWDLTGRKSLPKGAKNIGGRNLYSAHRVSSLKGIPVRTAVSGCIACHSVVITNKGKVYTWGRNDGGQLGHGDTERLDIPKMIDSISDLNIVSASCGKSHTLFLTDRGTVFAVGSNSSGQLGLGNQCPTVLMPTRIQYKGPPICKVAAGGDFSAIADVGGNVYTFGSPEYGQLGHNTDGKYFVTNTKLGFACETRPRRVMVFIEKTRDGQIIPITDVEAQDVACGQNHVVVLDRKERVFTWGFGGYGRLGHDDNKDELVPRMVKFFDGPNRGAKSIGAGSTFTVAVNKLGALYLWGQNRNHGDATMYPKPVHDLSGWNIRSIGCCNKSIVVVADNSVISWGSSPTYGELGYGDSAAKSSTTPQEMKPLDGIYIHRVSCGWGHTLFIARNDTPEEQAKLDELPDFVP